MVVSGAHGVALLFGSGSNNLGESPYLFIALGLILSVITVQLIWRLVVENKSNDKPRKHGEQQGMIICPECNNPTESEYRFCRICASDTGKGYVDMVEPDDSSQSGMF
ncbi:MAG: hypothetical protein SXQ77_03230 [Halobacteria archaeon]|nr:hypothetical protein [Halobacteria archaeon]